MNDRKIIGIDLGATNIRGAVVSDHNISDIISQKIHSQGTLDEVLQDIFKVVDTLLAKEQAEAIGIGVPSIVDIEQGIVYDVQYIPSWKEVHLKKILEERYQIPVYVNNDANCFAVGEYFFGKGKDTTSMIGLTLGTGLGAGIIINGHLFAGVNCGAGELGFFPYLDNILEYYCSGSFFSNVYGLSGVTVFENAKRGEENALRLYEELGTHIGHAIKMTMYAYDPQLIVLGGSVSHAYPLFQTSMWKELNDFPYKKAIERIRIEISELENSGIIGAAALYYNTLPKN